LIVEFVEQWNGSAWILLYHERISREALDDSNNRVLLI